MPRTSAEVLYRDAAGRKQCGRGGEWLPEDRFGADSRVSDGLKPWCNRCMADAPHHLTVQRRQEMLEQQDGRCQCGLAFNVHGGGRKTGYEIDHNHGCCPGRFSCGECINALVCQSCNNTDRNNPDRAGRKGSTSRHRGVGWCPRDQKWQVAIKRGGRGGKNFYPKIIGLPRYYADEDEAGIVARKLEEFLDANPNLWRAAV